MSSSVHPPASHAPVQLTPQERAALTAAAIGLTQSAAARHLGLSLAGLKKVLHAAVVRLGAASTTHAVALAVLDGHLDPEAIRGRVAPAWPGDRGRGASLARFGVARAARVAAAVEQRARFGRLIEEGLSPKEAAARLGIPRSTARRYGQQLAAEAGVEGDAAGP